ncbi:MAG: DUF3606 domain-containing protein [Comamonadaceae bacterium]|nr:MAG: DUF3606 domain-containing protein [Comamonadaceae bacterium]
MSDDKSKTGADRQRVSTSEDYELRDWAKSLNTTPEKIKEAVSAVGNSAEKVREYIGGRK